MAGPSPEPCLGFSWAESMCTLSEAAFPLFPCWLPTNSKIHLNRPSLLRSKGMPPICASIAGALEAPQECQPHTALVACTASLLPSFPGGHLNPRLLLYCPYFKPSPLLLCSKKQKENQEDLLKRVNEETMRQLRHAQVPQASPGAVCGAGCRLSACL